MAKEQPREPEQPKSMGEKFSALVESAKDRAAQSWQEFRIGEGHLAGMGRKGAVELGQYLPAFNNAGTHTVEDQGVFPNQTQGEIARGRGETGLDAEEENRSVLGYELQPARQNGPEQDRQQSRGR